MLSIWITLYNFVDFSKYNVVIREWKYHVVINNYMKVRNNEHKFVIPIPPFSFLAFQMLSYQRPKNEIRHLMIIYNQPNLFSLFKMAIRETSLIFTNKFDEWFLPLTTWLIEPSWYLYSTKHHFTFYFQFMQRSFILSQIYAIIFPFFTKIYNKTKKKGSYLLLKALRVFIEYRQHL